MRQFKDLVLIFAIMISVLIPVFNYDILPLVRELHQQLEGCNIPFEVRCLEDASDEELFEQNRDISSFKRIFHSNNDKNLGRTLTRQKLAERAKYDWLLFLDADVMPCSNDFVKHYIRLINARYDAIFGGIAYNDEKPSKHLRLRWAYGKAKEEVKAANRNKNPFKHIVSANFFIKKDLFLEINSKIDRNCYGLDNYFSSLLRVKRAQIYHIDNEVLHLGLEPSGDYIIKKEKAAETLLELYNQGKVQQGQNNLLNTYVKIKSFWLKGLFSTLFGLFKKPIRANLLSDQPYIFLLQLYRLGYMCHKNYNR